MEGIRTYEEVAKIMKMSKQGVYNHEVKAMRKLVKNYADLNGVDLYDACLIVAMMLEVDPSMVFDMMEDRIKNKIKREATEYGR